MGVVIVVLLMFGWTLSVTRAQADLTQTYTDPEGSFSIMYPSGWSVFSSSIGSVSLGGDDMQAQISYAGGSGMDTSFKDMVGAFANMASEPPVFTDVDLGDKKLEKAQLKVASSVMELVGIDVGGKLSAIIIGSAYNASVDKLDPILVAMATSYQAGTGSGGGASSPATTQPADTAQPTATTAVATGDSALPPMTAVARPTVTGTAAIAFTSTDVDRPGIALIEPSGQNFSLLTHNKFTDWLPSFSPDGTMIAFVAEDDPNNFNAWDVYVVPSSGGEPRKLSSKPSTDPAAVAWSPDSQQLIFIAKRSDADGGAGIYKVNVDGSGEQKLSLDGMDGGFVTLDLLAWSNDGTRIAFVGVPPGANDWTFTFADADGTHLTAGPKFNIAQVGTTFQWSPDGQHALYSDAASLEVTDADGNNPTVLVDKSENLRLMGASWSPDGTQIAFAAVDQSGTVASLNVMNADGSNRQKVDLGQHDLDTLGVSWGVIAAASDQTAAPAQPTTDAGSAAAAVSCTVTASGTANLRSGPGTSFDKAGTLTGGASQSVTGQATGSDGKVWYQLDGGSYVRSDLVAANGDCASVPTVSP